MLLLAIVVGLSTDWKEEARKAKERVASNTSNSSRKNKV